MGIEGLKKVVLAAAELLNVVSKVTNKKGIFAVFDLADELSSLSNIDVEALKKEVADLSDVEKLELVTVFKDKLVLVNPELEKKIESGVDLLNEAVDAVVSIVALIQKAKALVG